MFSFNEFTEITKIDEAKDEFHSSVKKLHTDGRLSADDMSRNLKDGTITLRKGFFYRNGKDSQQFADDVSKKLTDAGIHHTVVNHGEVDKSFKGGGSTKQNSHFHVTIKPKVMNEEVLSEDQPTYKMELDNGDKVKHPTHGVGKVVGKLSTGSLKIQFNNSPEISIHKRADLKHIKEEVESVDEANMSYQDWKKKLPNDISHIDSTEEEGKSHAYKMVQTPDGKRKYKIGTYYHNSNYGDMHEEVEQIDELSKKTLGSYVKAAAKDAEQAGQDQEHYGDKSDYARGEKRQKGISKAIDRLTKEEADKPGTAGMNRPWGNRDPKNADVSHADMAKKHREYARQMTAVGQHALAARSEAMAKEHDKMALQKEETMNEASFADTMKKAITAHERGDKKLAKYHLDNAKTARYGLKSTEISKNKDMLDKYKELSAVHGGHITEELDEALTPKGHTIEAYGVRGMKATPWRKTFKHYDHLAKWADENDSVEVHGTRDLDAAKHGRLSPAMKESVVPDRMKGKQKPYVSSDGKGNYEVLGNTGQTKATFSRAEHGKDAHVKAQKHLKSKYNEYMKEETLDELEEGVIAKAIKSVKRGMQGWDKNAVGPNGEKLGDPKAVMNRVKSRSDDELKNIHNTLNDPDKKFVTRNTHFDNPTKHSPAGLQKRVVDREMKKRKLTKEETEMNESINSNDYHVTSEPSQFGGHRPKVVHKEKGHTMYLGQHGYKSKEAAKSGAKAYLDTYEKIGPNAASKAAFAHAKSHPESIKEESKMTYNQFSQWLREAAEVDNGEGERKTASRADKKVGKDGRKYPAGKIKFNNGDEDGSRISEEIDLEDFTIEQVIDFMESDDFLTLSEENQDIVNDYVNDTIELMEEVEELDESEVLAKLKKQLAQHEKTYDSFAAVGGPPRSHPVHAQMKKVRKEIAAVKSNHKFFEEVEELDEVEGKVYQHKGTYGTSYDGDDTPAKKVAPTVSRGRGRPKKGSDETGEVKKFDFSQFTKKIAVPKFKGNVTTHKI